MDEKPHKPFKAPASFSSLIGSTELRARLIRLARFRGIPAGDCEDIASEAIARAVSNQQEYDPDRGSFFWWIKKITENVICSYYRRLNAQKRKPEGGIISSDAPAGPDANPAEVRNARADAKRKASEEAEHFLHVAKLSDKEAAAIGSRRNKQFQDADVKDNSSAGRRAMKKLQQIASDEKFRDSPRGPEPPSECAYGKIPCAEHDAAILYDAARQISWFDVAIRGWRTSPEWKELQAYLDKERAAKRFPLAIPREHWPAELSRYRHAAHERDTVLRRRFEAAVEIAVAFLEWPSVGYCRLEPNERRRRLEEFGWQFGLEPFWEIDDRTFEFFVNATDDIPDPKLGLAAFSKSVNEAPQNASDKYSSVHLFRIDKRQPPKTIQESFNRWLVNELNGNSKPIGRSGRRRTTRLVGFACIRLIDEFGLTKAEAMSWLKEYFGAPVPSTPERLERAVRATRQGLEELLPPPAEIGI